MVWRAAERDDFVEDVQAMRRRVEEHVPAEQAERELKLGPGGLRDVEFSVQLLQLVHGRVDPRAAHRQHPARRSRRSPTYGYVGRDDAAELDRAYRFLRTVEHRLQLHRLRRTHVVPDGPGRPAPAGPLARPDAGDPAARAGGRSGAGTPARSAGCTRSSSTARCSPPRRG